jgi:hypothetical protein
MAAAVRLVIGWKPFWPINGHDWQFVILAAGSDGRPFFCGRSGRKLADRACGTEFKFAHRSAANWQLEVGSDSVGRRDQFRFIAKRPKLRQVVAANKLPLPASKRCAIK